MGHQNELDDAKGPHTYDREKGIQPVDYKHQEFPKSIDGVTVNSQKEEDILIANKKKAEKSPKAESVVPQLGK